MEPRLRASTEQFSVLVEFMERHNDLGRPQTGPQGRLKADRLWQELTGLLNSMGSGVERTADKWKKVWADWKTKTKKKHLLLRQHANRPGGGPPLKQSLTHLEERVIAIMVGLPGIDEQTRTTRQATPDSLRSTVTPPRCHRLRRNRVQTPFGRAAIEFASVEQRRLQLEEARERRFHDFLEHQQTIEERRLQLDEAREQWLHERETERLRQEAVKTEVSIQHNQLLKQIVVLAEKLINTIE